MNTYRIDPQEIEGVEVLATGYKIFNDDWTAHGDYPYTDENGTVEGSIHKVDGELNHCQNGLHFCPNPLDCMKYYDPVQWNKFAKVSAYGDVRHHEDGKSEAQILKIDQVLSFDDFVGACKEYGIRDGSGIRNGYGIINSSGIRDGYSIRNGYGLENCKGISECWYCKDCNGLYSSAFCTHKNGAYKLFNKQVSKKRMEEISKNLEKLANGWFPKFNTAHEMYKENGNKWECVPPHKIQSQTAKQAYADMPQKLLKYICSLPEFDAEIFEKITGIETL